MKVVNICCSKRYTDHPSRFVFQPGEIVTVPNKLGDVLLSTRYFIKESDYLKNKRLGDDEHCPPIEVK